MKVYLTCLIACAWFSFAALVHGLAWGQVDKSADREALPTVPEEFEVTLFASEPLVRQPCSMAFDERGRLFVGMGPQYRNPKPDTPGDSVVLFLDTNGDGKADTTKEFATGFNAIQGMAWHGRDLWIANAPDLTIVRDLDGDDEADEYIKVYTDLGNLEHGLHGLSWAPDGKLYMSKGNSKGLNQPGRYAPKPFRDLWGLTAPADVPDFPSPLKFRKDDHRRAYHDPADDWGLDGGVLRCDDGGHNLEIIARGFRNPWDIAIDSGFNWIGTDNDQVGGDRVVGMALAAARWLHDRGQSSTHVGWLECIPEERGNWTEWVSFARTTGQSILLGFSAAIRGHEIEAWSDQQIVSSAMETLRTIFGEDIPLPVDHQITESLR